MAELDVVSDAHRLKTILGSCVGIVLRDPERGVSGFAHIMLPVRQRDDTAVGKYADSAIPALLKHLAEIGGRQSSLQVLLIGGSSGRSVVYDNATGQVSVKTLNAFHSKEVPA